MEGRGAHELLLHLAVHRAGLGFALPFLILFDSTLDLMLLYLLHLPPAPLPPDVFDRLSRYLPPEALGRIARFRLPEDALRSLVGRLAPIWYLHAHALLPPGEIPIFSQKGKGKPILTSPVLDRKIEFNTSHEGRYVLLGVARGHGAEVGVDLMRVPDDPVDVQEGVSDQLTVGEKLGLAVHLTPGERARRLAALWTAKEGYTKAVGEGIGFGLERINVRLDDRGEVEGVEVDGVDAEDLGWHWGTGWVDGEKYGWVVWWKGEDEEVQIEHIQWDEFHRAFR